MNIQESPTAGVTQSSKRQWTIAALVSAAVVYLDGGIMLSAMPSILLGGWALAKVPLAFRYKGSDRSIRLKIAAMYLAAVAASVALESHRVNDMERQRLMVSHAVVDFHRKQQRYPSSLEELVPI